MVAVSALKNMGASGGEPTRALSGPLDPMPQRLTRVARFDFLNLVVNGAPSHPLPTGTLKHTNATVAYIVKCTVTMAQGSTPTDKLI